MCGLYGYIGTKKKISVGGQIKRLNILRGLAVSMEARGTDSTGIGYVNNENMVFTLKDALPASNFVSSRFFNKRLKDINPRIVIGHTRLGTIGEAIASNAHPFIKGRIVGAHNGSVKNYLDINKNVSVDSEVIFELINKYNNDYKKAFKELEGRFAITWINVREPDKLYIARKDNPLYMAYSEELDTIFWCSLSDPLESVLVSNNILEYELKELDENTSYVINTDHEITNDKIEFKTPTTINNLRIFGANEDDPTEKWGKTREDYERSRYGIPTTGHSTYTKFQFGYYNTLRIKDKLENSGCDFCEHSVKEKISFYWHTIREYIICSECHNILSADDPAAMLNITRIQLDDFEKAYDSFRKQINIEDTGSACRIAS